MADSDAHIEEPTRQFPLYTISEQNKPNVAFIGQIAMATSRDKFKGIVEKAVDIKIGDTSVRKIFAKKSRIYRKYSGDVAVYQYGFVWFNDATEAKLAALHFRTLSVDGSRWTSYRCGLQNEEINMVREVLTLDTFECPEISVIFAICREFGNSTLKANIDLVRFRSISAADLAKIVVNNPGLLSPTETGFIFRMICDDSFISNRFQNRQRLIELNTFDDSSPSNSDESE